MKSDSINDSFCSPHKLTMTRMCTVVSNVSLSNIGNLDTVTASGKKMIPHVHIKTDSCSRKRKKKNRVAANSADAISVGGFVF